MKTIIQIKKLNLYLNENNYLNKNIKSVFKYNYSNKKSKVVFIGKYFY
jgi:hypothetical protein